MTCVPFSAMRDLTYAIIFITFFIKVNTSTDDVESWTGKWFPQKPHQNKNPSKDLDELFRTSNVETSNNTSTSSESNTEKWKGNWFPENPTGGKNIVQNKTTDKEWSGNWFPQKPSVAGFNNAHNVNSTAKGQKEEISTKSWDGKWFPQMPSDAFEKRVLSAENAHRDRNNKTWKGNWFPQSPLNIESTTNSPGNTKEEIDNTPWNGIWFPASPSSELLDLNRMPNSSPCDNGKDNINIDFDPDNRRHGNKYLCLDFKAKYEPNYSVSPIQRKFEIPSAYKAPSYCMNKTITYEDRLPTFGAHRYLPPKYGEYKFLPVQRWMHSLEKGAIVMLYHPCANQMQVEKLRNAVRACLYRHVISPSTLLLPERPLALVAWGTSLEMSVVHLPSVVDFIKENAKHGPQTTNDDNKTYEAGFLVEAKLVTDDSDLELCANLNL